MATIEQDLQRIREAVYGEEVREAIADGIEKCYRDQETMAGVANLTLRSDAIGQKLPGMMSLSELGTFANMEYYYPSKFENITFMAATEYPVIAPKNLYIRISSGYKALAFFIASGGSSSNTGWQQDAIYIPKGTKFVINIEKLSHSSSYVADIVEHVNALKVFDDDANAWFDARKHNIPDSFVTGYNITYATGAVNSGQSGYWQMWRFTNPKFNRIKVHASVYGRDIAEIAFYNTTEPSANSYMGTTVSAAAGSWDQDHWVYADVPEGCKLVCVCSRAVLNNNSEFNPEIFVDDIISYVKDNVIKGHSGLSIFQDYHYIYHYFANDPENNEIPQNSLADIDLAHRLGFKVYEINAHPTATRGKYVCFHGVSGRIGNYLVSKTGEDISNLNIDSVTENTFLTKYVYKTTNPKYATRVTFLEEALAACKRYGMIPTISWGDYDMIEVVRNICGDNFILGCYNTWYLQRELFKGCYSYYGTLTATELTDLVEKVGAPFHYCITTDQANNLSEEELRELMRICHDHGCLIGSAGIYQSASKNMLLNKIGFDFMAVGWEVPPFESGNLARLRDNDNYLMYSITNGTVANGVLSLYNGSILKSEVGESTYVKDGAWDVGVQGDSVVVSNTGRPGEVVSYGTPRSLKGQLRIRFNGILKITLGSRIVNQKITSDGVEEIILSSYFHRAIPNFTAVSSGTTSVYECSFDASVV